MLIWKIFKDSSSLKYVTDSGWQSVCTSVMNSNMGQYRQQQQIPRPANCTVVLCTHCNVHRHRNVEIKWFQQLQLQAGCCQCYGGWICAPCWRHKGLYFRIAKDRVIPADQTLTKFMNSLFMVFLILFSTWSVFGKKEVWEKKKLHNDNALLSFHVDILEKNDFSLLKSELFPHAYASSSPLW